MGGKPPSNNGVPWTRRVFDSTVHFAANLAHNRLFVYILIALAMSYGVGKWDAHQRGIQHRQDHRSLVTQQLQDYKLCKGIEQVKAQANQRIELLKIAEKAVIFRTPQIERKLSKLVDKATPLPKVDCTPLRPGK